MNSFEELQYAVLGRKFGKDVANSVFTIGDLVQALYLSPRGGLLAEDLRYIALLANQTADALEDQDG